MVLNFYQIFILLISSFLLILKLRDFNKVKEIKFAAVTCFLFVTLCYLASSLFDFYILLNSKSAIALFYAYLISIYITTKRQIIKEINEERPYIAIYKKTALMIGLLGISISCCFFVETLCDISMISDEAILGFREVDSVHNN